MTVTLQNRSPSQRIFHLHHAAACADSSCSCERRTVGVQDHDPKSGKRTLRAHKHRVPASVTLNAYRSEGDQVSGLPDGVISAPEVAKAIRAKAITWSKDEAPTMPAHHAAKLAHAKRVAETAAEENARAAEDKAKAGKAAEADKEQPKDAPEAGATGDDKHHTGEG